LARPPIEPTDTPIFDAMSALPEVENAKAGSVVGRCVGEICG
jgi:hypothetical protein